MGFSIHTVGKIIFGAGCLREFGGEIGALGSQVLLVTGKDFLRRTGQLAAIEKQLREQSLSVTVFDEVPREPSLEVVERGIIELQTHECDVVAAVGGGSAIDAGKAIAALAGAPGTLHEYFRGRELEQKGRPFIALPTTAGSGAEVTPNAVLVDEEQKVKASIRSAYMLADVAIVDPELTLTLPGEITAHSGMDALCQAVEAFVSRGANPVTDALAEDSAVRLMHNLPLAYRDGKDLAARTEVALGSLMGAMAFTNARLGLAHSMAHPLGVVTGLPHGLICALLLPAVVRFNAPVSAAKYARLARSARIADAGTPDDDAVRQLAAAIERLNAEMGIEARRDELRISRQEWTRIVSQTVASGSARSNPRSVNARDVEQILDCL